MLKNGSSYIGMTSLRCQAENVEWKRTGTSYPPCAIEVCEREAGGCPIPVFPAAGLSSGADNPLTKFPPRPGVDSRREKEVPMFQMINEEKSPDGNKLLGDEGRPDCCGSGLDGRCCLLFRFGDLSRIASGSDQRKLLSHKSQRVVTGAYSSIQLRVLNGL